MQKILVLEDEESIRSFIRVNLKRNGFQAVEACSGEEALEKVEQAGPITVALLDVMLPGIDGFEVCRILKERYPGLGIIMLTAKGQEADKVSGLVLGADDYVVKPFSPKELIARINALIRRLQPFNTQLGGEAENRLCSGIYCICLDKKKFYKGEKEIDLTPKEFEIIKLFLHNVDKAISRDDILNQIWGRHYIGDLKIVDVNIRRIRQKIENDPSNPATLEKVWGYGYRWRGGVENEGH
ncbi:two component transcriptional regulator, winged helix family [Desulforamulus reducens MI-1]|uniref:Stage 0 sporulation protein A homolog n=1 Tax=Desulforamulus reducens (strain ATCC BAA-1160 / DSM 100696 / MI-1) TaxID=349161 RepID=A4J7U5_DESRM|nr:response regulator transcription factor [Desulforamulus reducens]ABO51148.1 two component transcriptional regulator, winged helix family [Desulforamulus reducens MI-1]